MLQKSQKIENQNGKKWNQCRDVGEEGENDLTNICTNDNHVHYQHTNIVDNNTNLQHNPSSSSKGIAHNSPVSNRFPSFAEPKEQLNWSPCEECNEEDHSNSNNEMSLD